MQFKTFQLTKHKQSHLHTITRRFKYFWKLSQIYDVTDLTSWDVFDWVNETISRVCDNGQRLPDDKFCDGTPDCFDSSDELGCGLYDPTFPLVQRNINVKSRFKLNSAQEFTAYVGSSKI